MGLGGGDVPVVAPHSPERLSRAPAIAFGREISAPKIASRLLLELGIAWAQTPAPCGLQTSRAKQAQSAHFRSRRPCCAPSIRRGSRPSPSSAPWAQHPAATPPALLSAWFPGPFLADGQRYGRLRTAQTFPKRPPKSTFFHFSPQPGGKRFRKIPLSPKLYAF